MSDGPRYRFRRGERERIVDVVGGGPPSTSPPPRVAQGSVPALRPPALDPRVEPDDLDDLAPPAAPVIPTVVQFGGLSIVVERRGGTVTLVLPGAIRLAGTDDEARRLAAELASRR